MIINLIKWLLEFWDCRDATEMSEVTIKVVMVSPNWEIIKEHNSPPYG